LLCHKAAIIQRGEIGSQSGFRSYSLFKGYIHMCKIVLAAVAGAALSLAACSGNADNAASETSEAAAADTQVNADATSAVSEASSDAAAATSATDATSTATTTETTTATSTVD
jgi:hypothetical protein